MKDLPPEALASPKFQRIIMKVMKEHKPFPIKIPIPALPVT